MFVPLFFFFHQWVSEVQGINKVCKNCLDKLNGSLPPPPSEMPYATSKECVRHSNPVSTTVGK